MGLYRRILEWFWRKRRDNCEICGGTRGGVLGNENRVEGVVMCDYCHADNIKYPRFWECEPSDER